VLDCSRKAFDRQVPRFLPRPRSLVGRTSPSSSPNASIFKNLINYGILLLEFDDDSVYDKIKKGDVIVLNGLRKQLSENKGLEIKIQEEQLTIAASHNLSPQMIEVLLAGGLTNWVRVQK